MEWSVCVMKCCHWEWCNYISRNVHVMMLFPSATNWHFTKSNITSMVDSKSYIGCQFQSFFALVSSKVLGHESAAILIYDFFLLKKSEIFSSHVFNCVNCRIKFSEDLFFRWILLWQNLLKWGKLCWNITTHRSMTNRSFVWLDKFHIQFRNWASLYELL